MTVSATPRRSPTYTGNGTTVSFPFAFKVFGETDVSVVRADAAGIETVLMPGADFMVAVNADQDATPGGSVILTAAPSEATRITIVGSIPLDQPTDLPDGGAYRAQSVENALDRLAMQVQQVNDKTERALRAPVTGDFVDLVLPAPAPNAFIGWSPQADQLVNLDLDDLVTNVTYGSIAVQEAVGTGIAGQTVVLADNPGSINNIEASISGVAQRRGADYIWDNALTVTFVGAVPVGAVIVLRYGQALPVGQVSDGAVSTNKILDGAVTSPKLAPGAVNLSKLGTDVMELLDNAAGKNRIINGTFAVNQRAFAGGSLAAGVYGHDLWKASAGGATYTVSEETASITAGALTQIIEGLNVPEGGTYTLSWEGTARGKINGGATLPSPITVAGLAANANVTIQFFTGTLTKVQFEAGGSASGFERRLFGQELALCQRYYWQTRRNIVVNGYTPGGSFIARATLNFPVQMRVAPTVLPSFVPGANVLLNSVVGLGADGFQIAVTSTANAPAGNFETTLLAATPFSAEL